jgi:hypothetical protein
MALYRKKSLVEAEEAKAGGSMDTKTGLHSYQKGDFIITNPDGERYPCPRDVFFKTYELVPSLIRDVTQTYPSGE